MKILVFGAGVLGCNLARGSWAEEIQKNGLRIKDKFSPRMCCSLSMPSTAQEASSQASGSCSSSFPL